MVKNILFLSSIVLLGVWLLHSNKEMEAATHFPMDHAKVRASAVRFVPNQGQWPDQVRYRIKLNSGYIFLEDNQLTYHLIQADPTHPHRGSQTQAMGLKPMVKGHAFRVVFEGAKQSIPITPTVKHETYHNYFLGNDPSKWASKVPLFGKVTYQQMYQGIDLRLYGDGDALKYDFLVHPHADIEPIKLKFEGADKVYIDKEGNLQVKTSLGEITELAPIAYQWDGDQQISVRCGFKVKGNRLTYVFPDGYDPNLPLVIDPTLIFSTLTGSTSDNWGFTATYDDLGFAYAGGIEHNSSFTFGGYPTFPLFGAYQTFNRGQNEVTISKFTPDGASQVYATYIGGGEDDQPHSLIVNRNQELVIMGRTSSNNFPTTLGAYDESANGGTDIFVTKLSADGSRLIGSTYLGGSSDDGANGNTSPAAPYTNTKWNYGDDARGEVILDAAENILIAAPTQSLDFPVTPNAYQDSYQGNQDGCIVKLNPTLTSIQWSTYFGGASEDAIHSVKIDSLGGVIVVGGSSSNDLPITTGAYQNTNQGGSADGFIAKLNSDGTNLIAGTYLGTNQYDQVYLIDLDEDNNIYVTGQTQGNWPIVSPTAGPVYQNAGGKQFIVKLDESLTGVTFSTVFGAGNQPNISPTAFLVDRCENLYVTGWGGELNFETNRSSTLGLPTTSDALRRTSDGSDFYLIVLARDAQNLLYGSYFGSNGRSNNVDAGDGVPRGDHVDGGTSRFDKNGIVYHAVCAQCGSAAAFPPTPGVFSPTTGYPRNCNMAIFKMSFDLSGVVADFDNAGNVISTYRGCPPLTINFDNRSFEGGNPVDVQYRWLFGVGNDSSTLERPTYTYDDPGTYQVRLVIIDSASCNISDTSFRTITVFEPPVVDAGPDQTSCPGDTLSFQTFSDGVGFDWVVNGAGTIVSDPSQPQVDVQIDGPGELYLTLIDTNGCQATDTVRFELGNNLQVSAGTDTTICQGGGLTLSASGDPAETYIWTSSPAVPISNPTQSSISITNLDTTTLFFLSAQDATGCEAFDSVRVEVFEVRTLADTSVCSGQSIVLTTQGGVSFDWLPDDGSLSDLTSPNPVASPTVTTTYTVTARSAAGCISVREIEVEVLTGPAASAGPDQAVCQGESVQLQGAGGQSFAWFPTLGLSDPTIANPMASPAQTTTYILEVTDLAGCTNTDSTVVTVHPLPSILASGGTEICEGETTELMATGGVSYVWSPANGLSDPNISNPQSAPSTTTLYTVTGLDANGCTNTDTTRVTVITRPITSITGENRTCQGDEIVLIATGGERYVWSTGETTPSISVDSSTFGTFLATAFVGDCEGIPDSITIDAGFGLPTAAFEFTPDAGYAPQEFTFINNSTAATRYEWNFGSGALVTEENPMRVFPSAGTFVVELVAFNEFDCTDTAIATLSLENVTLHVPSAFSPNQDGINDQFYIGSQGIRTLTIQIFSRWGMKVYEGNGPDFRWDGLYKGTPVPEGVYTFQVSGIGENDARYQKVGTVTIYR